MQSELTPERIAELRAKAEAATPGSREVAGCEAHRGNLNSNCRRVRLMDGSIVGPREEDMQHLAAFDRETCLALLDAAEERDRATAWNDLVMKEATEAVRRAGGIGEGGHAVDRLVFLDAHRRRQDQHIAELEADLARIVRDTCDDDDDLHARCDAILGTEVIDPPGSGRTPVAGDDGRVAAAFAKLKEATS